MPVETPSLFAQVIQDHLELKQRNQELEPAMPLDRYLIEDPFDNHPLFKTEEQAAFSRGPVRRPPSTPSTPRTRGSGAARATSTGATSSALENGGHEPQIVDERVELASPALVVALTQDRRRMDRRGHALGNLGLDPLAAVLCDAELLTEQRLRRGRAQADDHPRRHDRVRAVVRFR